MSDAELSKDPQPILSELSSQDREAQIQEMIVLADHLLKQARSISPLTALYMLLARHELNINLTLASSGSGESNVVVLHRGLR